METVLSLMTGIPLVPLENVADLVNFMHGQTVHSTRLPEAIKLCQEKIGNEYRELKDDGSLLLQVKQMKGIFPPGSEEDMAAIFMRHWLAAMKKIFEEQFQLFPLPYKLDLANPI